jgi:cytochrome c biogenesis protein ResB
MKSKLFTILIAFFVMSTITSCVKERSCTCVRTINNEEMPSKPRTIKDTKKNAKEECEKDNQTGVDGSKVECTLD